MHQTGVHVLLQITRQPSHRKKVMDTERTVLYAPASGACNQPDVMTNL